ncbi:hypothetical protein PEC18_31545 [Paucibacter sp. O1-1]|nr:hypothetical protein [Paucibacter sp. O1-1]MDA3830238.1 hypothetical protein [Paucibacter sp. O1-1]
MPGRAASTACCRRWPRSCSATPTTERLDTELGALLRSCEADRPWARDAGCAWISWRGRRDGLRLSLADGRLQRLQWQLALEQQ